MRTFAEFQHHIQLHQKRVVKLGLALAQAHFPRLNTPLLEPFLTLHDHSKTLTAPEALAQFAYGHPEAPARRLFEFYGWNPLDDSDTRRLLQTVNDINAIDDEVRLEFFKQHPEISWGTQDDFYTIERVADLVDRSLDPIAAEEFGHPMVLASDFVQDPYIASLAMWLEKHYREFTKNLSFPGEACYKLAE